MYNYAIWQTHLVVVVLACLHLVRSSTAPCAMINLSRPEQTSVTLTMEYKSTAAENISVVEWWNIKRIMRYYPGNKLVVQPIYKGRVKFDKNTLVLQLMNLQKNDSGFYHGYIIEREKGTICAAKYNLSVVELVAAPTLTLVSNWSSSDSCNVTGTCRGHDLSLTFRCNSSDCTLLGDLPITPSLAVFARDGHIICNQSNQVSWRNDTLDMSPLCVFAEGQDTPFWISLTGFMSLIVVVCVVMIVVYAHRKRKQRSTGTSENYVPVESKAILPGPQI